MDCLSSDPGDSPTYIILLFPSANMTGQYDAPQTHCASSHLNTIASKLSHTKPFDVLYQWSSSSADFELRCLFRNSDVGRVLVKFGPATAPRATSVSLHLEYLKKSCGGAGAKLSLRPDGGVKPLRSYHVPMIGKLILLLTSRLLSGLVVRS